MDCIKVCTPEQTLDFEFTKKLPGNILLVRTLDFRYNISESFCDRDHLIEEKIFTIIYLTQNYVQHTKSRKEIYAQLLTHSS